MNMTLTELVAIAAVLLVAGAALGYFIALARVRRQMGGKTPVELRQELEDYRTDVTAHFHQTAELLGGMTEQYRAVYTHLARGASAFCGEPNQNSRLSRFDAGSLDRDPPPVDVEDRAAAPAVNGDGAVAPGSDQPGAGSGDAHPAR